VIFATSLTAQHSTGNDRNHQLKFPAFQLEGITVKILRW